MRGSDPKQPVIFSYVALEDRVPKDHPLHVIRRIVDRVLEDLSADFSRMYSGIGRPSIPPEQLLRALLIQVFYSVRSERQLMEQLDYNLLFRWFVGLNVDDPIWHPTTFTKNRDRLLAGDVAFAFFQGVLEIARKRHLLSGDHFTVDGTLLEAWASQKSFRPKDEDPGGSGIGRNDAADFRGEKRSNETHASITDPDARWPGRRARKRSSATWPVSSWRTVAASWSMPRSGKPPAEPRSKPRWTCWSGSAPPRAAVPSEPTSSTILASSSPAAETEVSLHTWRRTRVGDGARSIDERPGMPAMMRASVSGRRSSRASAGAKPSDYFASSATAGVASSTGSSPSPPQRTT
jgi:transposase